MTDTSADRADAVGVTVGSAGVTVDLPLDWTVRVDPAPGIAVLGVAPATTTPFRGNAAVTIGAVPAEMTLREWQAGTDQILPGTMEQYQLLDLEHITVSGLAGVRRLAHHVAGGIPVTMQQWAVLAPGTDAGPGAAPADGRGITLTVTVATADVAAVADVVDAIGASLTVDEGQQR